MRGCGQQQLHYRPALVKMTDPCNQNYGLCPWTYSIIYSVTGGNSKQIMNSSRSHSWRPILKPFFLPSHNLGAQNFMYSIPWCNWMTFYVIFHSFFALHNKGFLFILAAALWGWQGMDDCRDVTCEQRVCESWSHHWEELESTERVSLPSLLKILCSHHLLEI